MHCIYGVDCPTFLPDTQPDNRPGAQPEVSSVNKVALRIDTAIGTETNRPIVVTLLIFRVRLTMDKEEVMQAVPVMLLFAAFQALHVIHHSLCNL